MTRSRFFTLRRFLATVALAGAGLIAADCLTARVYGSPLIGTPLASRIAAAVAPTQARPPRTSGTTRILPPTTVPVYRTQYAP